MVASKWYGNGLKAFLAGDIDFDADTIKGALVQAAYTPSQAHDFWNDVSGNEASGTGYTAGGQALTTAAVSLTDDSAASAWQASTAYSVGDIVRPTVANGHIYKCIVAGTSGASEPTWPTTADLQVVDNTVTWREVGTGFIIIDSDQVQWTITDPGGLTARYLVIYKDTGTPSTSPLILYVDFEGDETAGGGGTFTVTPPAGGWGRVFPGF